MKNFSAVAYFLVLLVLTTAAHADFSDTLNLRSALGKGAWLHLRIVTWKFDTSDFVKGRSRLDIEIVVGNSGKAPIEIGPGSFAVRLGKNDRALFFTSMHPGAPQVQRASIAPKDSLITRMSFILPDTGSVVELKLTPAGSKTSSWLTFLPSVTSSCKRLARSAELFLLATTTFRKFMDEKRRSYYDEARSLYLTYLKTKISGPCTDARASDLEDLSKSALKLVNLDGQEIDNVLRGDRDMVSSMSFFLTMAKRPAQRILDQDSRK